MKGCFVSYFGFKYAAWCFVYFAMPAAGAVKMMKQRKRTMQKSVRMSVVSTPADL